MILGIATGIWVALVIVYFWIMLVKYPFKYWEEYQNPYEKETLGLPKGTIRTILALSVLFLFLMAHGYCLLVDNIVTKSIDQATFLVLAFYFSDKAITTITYGKNSH